LQSFLAKVKHHQERVNRQRTMEGISIAHMSSVQWGSRISAVCLCPPLQHFGVSRLPATGVIVKAASLSPLIHAQGVAPVIKAERTEIPVFGQKALVLPQVGRQSMTADPFLAVAGFEPAPFRQFPAHFARGQGPDQTVFPLVEQRPHQRLASFG
jgi:hypothetical protein